MDLWNVWTALWTGLVIGTSLGMVLTALLTISSADESRPPEVTRKKAERLYASTLQGDNIATPPDSIDGPAGPRVPLHFR